MEQQIKLKSEQRHTKDHTTRIRNWRTITKQKMVEAMGGCCQICGYNKYAGSIDFHHIKPGQKELKFSKRANSRKFWPTIVNELRKCVALCRNCHQELHGNKTQLPINYCLFNEEYADFAKVFNKEIKINNCRVCGKEISMQHTTCSRSCGGTLKGTINWSKIDLLKLLDENQNNYSKVAKILNETVETKKPLDPETVRRRAFKLRGIPRSQMIVKLNDVNIFIPTVAKEILLDLLNNKSTRELEIILNVSRKTISKWCKYYDIPMNARIRKQQLKVARTLS